MIKNVVVRSDIFTVMNERYKCLQMFVSTKLVLLYQICRTNMLKDIYLLCNFLEILGAFSWAHSSLEKQVIRHRNSLPSSFRSSCRTIFLSFTVNFRVFSCSRRLLTMPATLDMQWRRLTAFCIARSSERSGPLDGVGLLADRIQLSQLACAGASGCRLAAQLHFRLALPFGV